MGQKVSLIKPCKKFKNEYLNMLDEWKKSGEELIPWTLSLDNADFSLLVVVIN